MFALFLKLNRTEILTEQPPIQCILVAISELDIWTATIVRPKIISRDISVLQYSPVASQRCDCAGWATPLASFFYWAQAFLHGKVIWGLFFYSINYANDEVEINGIQIIKGNIRRYLKLSYFFFLSGA